MEIIEDNMDSALDIINALLQNKEIKKADNPFLYQNYSVNLDVQNLADKIAKKMGFEIYCYDNAINLCVMLGNKAFGYTNDELKRKIKMLNKNEEIYLMYFIILTIITCFYKESGLNSPRSYLGLDELLETINIKFNSLIKEDIEKVSKQREYNFRDIKKVWERLSDGREDVLQGGKNDKISFVKLVLHFLQDENLIFFEEERQIISITTRFKSIIYFYFEYCKENKNELLRYVYELGGNEDATY